MGNLFDQLWDRVEPNARHAWAVYTSDVSEYRPLAAEREAQQAVLDFGIFIRRRTLELAADDHPLTDADLAVVASVGRQRAERRLSLTSQHQVLGLHTELMLREIQQAANTVGGGDELLRLIAWFGAQGTRARAAYLQGYFEDGGRAGSATGRLEVLAKLLLTDQPVPAELALHLGHRVPLNYLVCVVRAVPAPAADRRSAALETSSSTPRPAARWTRPDEFVVLHPLGPDPVVTEPVQRRALDQLRAVVVATGVRCAVGSAVGPTGALADALATARNVSAVTPLETRPRALFTVADVFVELCAGPTVWADRWLGGFVDRMASGPHLISTLDVYYRNDLNRAATAAELRIHPRTLDYRLQRVRDLTGEDPGSTRGLRILSTAVNRFLATEPR